jgi:CheY-like chemotaxis protein
MPPVIAENMDIIIAVLAILAVVMLYLIVKQRKEKQNKIEILDDFENIKVVEDIYDTPHEEDDDDDEEEYQAPQEVEQQEETTKQIQEEVIEEKPQTPPQEIPNSHYNPQTKLTPQKVPSHGKITKEAFKKFAGIKILVAEDNLINQKVIDGLLKDSGVEIVFANDGLETLSYLNNQHDFDLVLMDAHMPNMDGFEATRKIRQNPDFELLPVIALSGDIAQDDIKKMYDAGMDAHLEKPLKIDALYDIFYAFTKVQNQEKTSQNQQLDTARGIAISGGDEKFYKELLSEFLSTYQDAHKTIKTLLEQGKLQEANALLLDLTGMTANLGTVSVHEFTLELKQTLQNLKDNTYKEAFKKFYNSYTTLIQEIKNYLHN